MRRRKTVCVQAVNAGDGAGPSHSTRGVQNTKSEQPLSPNSCCRSSGKEENMITVHFRPNARDGTPR